jgi:hypothetical protein
MKTKVNPRAQFWEDLTSFITTATADQAKVHLMLDANADMTDLEFSSFLVECGLQDLHDNCDIVPPPETYYREKRKIDFYLGTPGAANAVTQVEITSYGGGLKYSDHQALFVDINEELLFTSKGVDPTAHKGRGLRLKNKQALLKYREVTFSIQASCTQYFQQVPSSMGSSSRCRYLDTTN